MCSAATVDDGLLKVIPSLSGIGKECIDRRQICFIEDLADNICFLLRCHTFHGSVKVSKDVVEGTHIALGIIYGNTKRLHLRSRLVCRILQGKDDISKMRTTFGTLDTVIGKNTKCRVQFSRTALNRSCRSTDGKDTFTKLCHRGIGRGRSLCHLVYHGICLGCFHTKCRHSIGDHVGCRRKVDTASCRKVQNDRKCIVDFLRVVSGKCQIVHGIGTLTCGECRLRTHLLCQVTEGIHRVD